MALVDVGADKVVCATESHPSLNIKRNGVRCAANVNNMLWLGTNDVRRNTGCIEAYSFDRSQLKPLATFDLPSTVECLLCHHFSGDPEIGFSAAAMQFEREGPLSEVSCLYA